MSRVAAGAGLVSQARLVGGVLNILTLVFLTRLLPDKADFAVVAFVYMTEQLANAVGPLGLPSAISFFVPKLGNDVGRALALRAGWVLTALALPWAIALFFGGGAIAEWVNEPAVEAGLAVLAIGLIADFPGQTLPGYLIAVEKYVGAFWITLLFYISRFVSLIVPAALGLNIFWIVSSFAAVAILRGIAFWLYFIFFAEGPRRVPVGTFTTRELFDYGLPLAGSLLVGKLNKFLDKYMIAAIATAEIFAIYTVGAIELPLVPALAFSVTTALVPSLVVAFRDSKTAEFIGLWHSSMIKTALVMMPVFAVAFVLAEPVITVFFSVSYSEATLPFRVYLCLLPLRLCGYGAVVRAVGRTKPVLVGALIGLLVNAGLNYPFYLLFGLAGPAIASVVAQIVVIVLFLRVVRVELNLGWAAVFPFVPVLRTLIVALVAGVPLWFLAPYFGSSAAALAIGLPAYAVIYIAFGLAAGQLSKADLVYLFDFLTGRLVGKAR